jgi:hypothetical protein
VHQLFPLTRDERRETRDERRETRDERREARGERREMREKEKKKKHQPPHITEEFRTHDTDQPHSQDSTAYTSHTSTPPPAPSREAASPLRPS